MIAGYYGGTLDTVVLRAVEIFQAFPGLLFAMLVVQAVGAGIVNVILVLSFVGIPDYLRLARAEIQSRRSWQYAEAARMVGNLPWRVAFRHLLPNSIGPAARLHLDQRRLRRRWSRRAWASSASASARTRRNGAT